ncbi:hypothetical protein E2562_016793 [Oryza meyeriana var. granulata]|uniref:CRIB domain-containing protein n=1 Tax=Oryza meyeriana var. granulata TaxID=110450 RepID=A0A6G1BVV0_9ORYZ|nr:hypothetical protein E2562_016793 [Oryza meyeriana var. granulata]
MGCACGAATTCRAWRRSTPEFKHRPPTTASAFLDGGPVAVATIGEVASCSALSPPTKPAEGAMVADAGRQRLPSLVQSCSNLFADGFLFVRNIPMAYKMKGIFKGLKVISQIFVVKEHEMQIGSPTDVKHVAHIGWDGLTGNASPSWMNEIRASSELLSLGNFAPSAGTSWASQGKALICPMSGMYG